jgi:hypothetical protein
MPADRVRASDDEREDAVASLRAAAAQGRLSLEELDERTASAFAATTRGELAVLLDDLPGSPPAVRPPHKPPRVPGRFGFNARWRAPVRAAEAADDLLEYVAPPLRAFGYTLVEQTPERLVFERDVRPLWTFAVAVGLFPFGLLALLHTSEERVVFELLARGDETVIIAEGRAPLRIRRALTELER